MRRLSLFLILSIFSIIFCGCAKTLATVNGQTVTQKELDQELEKAGGRNMLETLIGRKLVEQDATAKHVTVSDQEIEEQLNNIKKTFTPADQQSLTADKLKTIRDEIRLNLLLKKAIMAKVQDSDIRDFYEKNKEFLPEVELSVIVVGDEKQAKAILEEIHRGKDFAAMARQFSLDPAGREKGGYVGYLAKGNLQQLSPQLADAAFSLNPGEVSPSIKTQKGYYLLKVLNKKKTYDELKDEVERQIAGNRAKTYLDDLREKAKIDYKGEYAKR